MGLVGDVFWFLRRPALYPELGRKVVRRLFVGRSEQNDTRDQATRWCNEKSISVDDAISRFNPSQHSLATLFKDEFEYAESMMKNTPVKMGGAGLIDVLYAVCEFTNANKVIETGVAYGWSSLAIMLSIEKQNGKLKSIDMPYPGMGNDSFVGCVVPPRLKENWELIRQADREGIPTAIAEFNEYDLCHYDSDKSYEGRVWAYAELWQNLRDGGVFMSDDISDNLAFKEFSESLSDYETVVVKKGEQFLGVILK